MRRGPRIGVALLGAVALALPSTATAASPVSQSFTTPGEQQFVVPPGVTSVQIAAVGGNGGPGNGEVAGGSGATVTATLAVTPGETLYAEVAGNGQSTILGAAHEEGRGGYGGGGYGGNRFILFTGAPGGGGGGGASDVRTCPAGATPAECGGRPSLASRLLVAAGGGGGGGIGLPSAEAGDGGPADHSGYAGKSDSQGDLGGSGGLRGTSSAGGAAGSPSADCVPPEGEGCALKGQLGLGGSGGNAQGGSGGGGGGGLYGGGGGGGGNAGSTGSGPSLTLYNGGGGGGGGGASGVPAGAAGITGFSLVATAEGAQPSITFTWTPSAPAVVTEAASQITATTAALTGTVNPSDWQIQGCAFQISPVPAGVAMFPCAQQLGAGSTPQPVSATAAGLTPSTTYTVTLLASSVQGTGSGSPVTFTTPASDPSSPSSCACASPADGGAPVVSALKLSPTRFRRGSQAAKLASRPDHGKPSYSQPSHTNPSHSKPGHSKPKVSAGTTISFQLSQAATVMLTFQRAHPGRLAGHSCLAPSTKLRHARRCTRYTPVSGAIVLAAHAAGNRIHFAGTLGGGRRLPPGSYRLTFMASNAAGHSTATQHPTFTLLP